MERLIKDLILDNTVKGCNIDDIELNYFNTRTKRKVLVAFFEYYKQHNSLQNLGTKEVIVIDNKEHNIGNALTTIRIAYKEGKLTKDEIEILEYMGIAWERYSVFEKSIDALVAYAKEYGSIADVKKKDTYQYKGKSIEIGEIVIYLRNCYRTGILSTDQISQLESIGIVWSTRVKDIYDVLDCYYNEHGTLSNIIISTKYVYDGKEIKLGECVDRLKDKYRTGKLPEDRVRWLETRGILWTVHLTCKYDKIDILRAYYEQHGTLANIRLYEKFIYNGDIIPIGSIVCNLRRFNGATSEQIEILNTMGMVWNVKVKYEHDTLMLLKEYAKQFGTLADICKGTYFEYQGKVYNMQPIIERLRRRYQMKELPEHIIYELDKLGMVWSKLEIIKQEIKDLLQDYYEKYGTLASIEARQYYEYNGKTVCIGRKIRYMREIYQDGTIDDALLEWLNERGIKWEGKRGAKSKTSNIGVDLNLNK